MNIKAGRTARSGDPSLRMALAMQVLIWCHYFCITDYTFTRGGGVVAGKFSHPLLNYMVDYKEPGCRSAVCTWKWQELCRSVTPNCNMFPLYRHTTLGSLFVSFACVPNDPVWAVPLHYSCLHNLLPGSICFRREAVCRISIQRLCVLCWYVNGFSKLFYVAPLVLSASMFTKMPIGDEVALHRDGTSVYRWPQAPQSP